ncbi:MAG: hypothetical protein IKW30_10030 [Lachnospiraceae bacterium]|nr:hypothetical protein [Lachnospiraceae bacterium]
MFDMKKNIYDIISIQEIIYLLSFLILFGARAVGLYEGKLLYNIALVLGILTWGIKILVTEHSVLEYVIICLLTLLALVIYKNTGEKGILLYFTMMLGMKNVSVRNVFKVGCGILSISYLLLVFSSILGINNEIMYIQHRNGWGDVFRHSLGYPHPNTLHNTYVILVVLIMYLVGKQNWKKLMMISVVMFIGSYYIYLYSGSRTGLLTTGLYLFVNFWLQNRKKIFFIEKIFIYALYPSCLIFSIIGPLLVKGRLFDLIDKILNTRWRLSTYYLQNEPISLFGVRFKEPPTIHVMIDSSFLYSFLQLGLVAFVIITFLFVCIIHKCIKLDARTELAIIISFCIMGISDPFMFNLSHKNFIFLFIGKMIYDYTTSIEVKKLPIMGRKIQMFKCGNKMISYPKITIKSKVWKKKDCLIGSFVFAFAIIASVCIYVINTEPPMAMYVNKVIWDDNIRRGFLQKLEGQGEEDFFTKEEVKELKDKGIIIIQYENEETPMCKVIGDAPQMEYKRNIVSVGFWSGILALVMWIIVKKGFVEQS